MSDDQLFKKLLNELEISNKELRASRDDYKRKNEALQEKVDQLQSSLEQLKTNLVQEEFDNITKVKTAENERYSANTRLNLALEIEKIAIWEWDVPGDRIINYNDHFQSPVRPPKRHFQL